MDENVVLCAVCSWRSVCKKKYSISGIEIFNCPDFSRDVSFTISGIEEFMNFINNFKNDRLN
jgi:hypothetical protein